MMIVIAKACVRASLKQDPTSGADFVQKTSCRRHLETRGDPVEQMMHLLAVDRSCGKGLFDTVDIRRYRCRAPHQGSALEPVCEVRSAREVTVSHSVANGIQIGEAFLDERRIDLRFGSRRG